MTIESGSMRNFVLANRMPSRICKLRQLVRPDTFFNRKSPPHSGILVASSFGTDLDQTLPYILISRTYGKCVWENKILVLGVCFPQTWSWSSTGSMFAASKSRLGYYRWIDESFRFVSNCTLANLMKCLVNWNLLRIGVRLRNSHPYLNADSSTRNRI